MWQDYAFLAHEVADGQKPLIGISACLSGEKVRYDGTDKHQPDIVETLTSVVELVPLCPEVAIGMGVPRPPIHLVAEGHRINAIPVDENCTDNYTPPLRDYARSIIDQYGGKGSALCGYIFKSRSPSCGLGSTPVYNEGSQLGFDDGIFAHQIASALPWLPFAEEEDLGSTIKIEYFLFRTLLIHDFNLCCHDGGGLEQFASQHAHLIHMAPRQIKVRLQLEHERSVVQGYQFSTRYLKVLSSHIEELGPAGLRSRLKRIKSGH